MSWAWKPQNAPECINSRPQCTTPGCQYPVASAGRKKNNERRLRALCRRCTVKKYNLNWSYRLLQVTPKDQWYCD